jgi:hypothetical protein
MTVATLVVLFLTYPTTTTAVLNIFSCYTLDTGVSQQHSIYDAFALVRAPVTAPH